MKKVTGIVLVIAMCTWLIYNLVLINSDENQRADSAEQESEAAMANQASDEVGLNRGNKAPDFELTTLEGETVKLSDYYGEPIMLNFWATWCGPCRAEMPDMQKFYDEKDVTILAVNLTDTERKQSDVTEFVDEFELTFPVLMDEEAEVSDLYRIQPIPTSYLIDKEGRIHNVAYGALNYESMVEEFEKIN